MSNPFKSWVGILGVVLVSFGVATIVFVTTDGDPVGVFLTLFLFISYLLPCATNILATLKYRIEERPGLFWLWPGLIMVALVSYDLYFRVGLDSSLLKVCYLLMPLALIRISGFSKEKKGFPGFAIILAILMVWLPVDAGVIQATFPWPPGLGGNLYAIPIGVFVLVYGLSVVKGLDMGFTVRPVEGLLVTVVVNYLLFISFAIPVGTILGFIGFNPVAPISRFLEIVVPTIFLVAVPEELLFRGVIQNYLRKSIKKVFWADLTSAVIFGLAHLNNGSEPDLRYGLLSTVAGYFYGRAYVKTGNLIPAVMVHAAVDLTWACFFKV